MREWRADIKRLIAELSALRAQRAKYPIKRGFFYERLQEQVVEGNAALRHLRTTPPQPSHFTFIPPQLPGDTHVEES